MRIKAQKINQKISELWKDTPEYVPDRAALKKENALSRWDAAFLICIGLFLFFLSWELPFNGGPDEALRYKICQFICRHGTLPVGDEPEILDKLWGISYAFQPYIPFIAGGWLMRLAGIFTTADKALLMAARLPNILLGIAFYWQVLLISRRLFARGIYRKFFVALLVLLPQLLYLFVYVNLDGMALFASAFLIETWLEGMKYRWDRASCTRLGAGVAVCALSYYNAYGYILMSIVLFAVSLGRLYLKKGAAAAFRIVVRRGLYVSVLALLLAGWWFVRSAILYDGDFLGMKASAACAEKHAQEEYKPSVKQSVKEQGIPLKQMLKNDLEGGMGWMRVTWWSFIGFFGFLEYPLGADIYEIHKLVFAFGALGMFAEGFLTLLSGIRSRKAGKAGFGQEGQFLLRICFLCCMIIPVLLALIYAYTSDYQAQGRYLMPMVVPLMYFTAEGISRIMGLIREKWLVCVLMLLQVYALLHVFLAAFVTVYLPSFDPGCSALAGITIPWVWNQGIVQRALHMLIPG